MNQPTNHSFNQPPQIPQGNFDLPPKQGKSPATCLAIAAIGMGVLIVLIGGIAAMVISADRNEAQPELVETDEQKRKAIEKAFRNPESGSVDQRKEVRTFFNEMHAAFNQNDAERFIAIVDVDRAVLRTRRRVGMPELPEAFERGFKKGMRQGLASNFDLASQNRKNESVELHSIQELGNGSELLVYVREHNPGTNVTVKKRYWLIRKNGKLKVFDFEELETGIGLSAGLEAGLQLAFRKDLSVREAEEMHRNSRLVFQFHQTFALGEVLQARRQLSSIDPAKLLGGQTLVVYWLAKARLAFYDGRIEDACAATRKMESLDPNSPLVFSFDTRIHFENGEYEKAVASAERFQSLVGYHSEVTRILGLSYQALEKPEKAATCFREAFLDEPNHEEALDNLYDLANALQETGSQLTDLKSCFPKLKNKSDSFAILANAFDDDGNWEAIRALVEAYGKLAPRDVLFDYYSAWLLSNDEKHKEAAAKIRPWLDKIDRERIEPADVFEIYANSVKEVESVEELYAKFEPKPDALRGLGKAYYYDPTKLFEICKLYEKDQGKDIDWAFYQSRALHLSGKSNEAYVMIKQRIKDVAKHTDFAIFLDVMQKAACKSGHSLEAYSLALNKSEAFRQMAGSLKWAGKFDELEQLNQARKKDRASDRKLPYYEAIVLENQGQFEEAWNVLRPILTKKSSKDIYQEQMLFIKMALKVGKLAESYEIAQNRSEIFAVIVQSMEATENMDDLEEVLKRHLQDHPESYRSIQAKIKVALGRSEWQKAVDIFRQGEKQFENQVRYCKYDIYRVMQTKNLWKECCELFDHQPEVLEHFWRLAFQKGDANQLQQLTALWKKHHPENPYAILSEIASLTDKGSHREALVLMDAKKTILNSGPSGSSLGDTLKRLRWECLIALGELAKTKDELKADQNEYSKTFGWLAVHMAEGDLDSSKSKLGMLIDELAFSLEEVQGHRLIRFAAGTEKGKRIADELFKSE